MEIAVVPTYKDIFKEDPPEIKDLIADVPSKLGISLFSIINAELFLGGNGEDTQLKIFKFIIQRFSYMQKRQLFKGISPYIKEGNNFISLFNIAYSTAFIEYELLNFRDFEIEDTNPDQEFRVFKSYLILIQNINEKDSKIFDEVPLEEIKKEEFFQVKTWPLIIKQFEFNYKVEPMFQAIKSIAMLDFLSKNSKTREYYNNFLLVVQKYSAWHYIFDFLEIVKVSFNYNNNLKFRNFSIIVTPEFEPFLDFFSIDVNSFRADKQLHIDYYGIKKKPLFRLQECTYIVMNWNFFYNQINLGLLFDFYNRSGIKHLYKKFPDFQNFIATHVSEDLLFKKLLNKSFKKGFNKVVFDDKSSDALPDCYYREGKYIFLFEFKDYLIDKNVIHNANYNEIKKYVDFKFICNQEGKSKGIRQILRQIKDLNVSPYYFDNFIEKGIKKRNIVIYPIIVYTNFFYSMPGLNNYLNNEFRAELNVYFSSDKFELGQVRDITMIDLEFFYRNFLNLERGLIDFRKLINMYHARLKAQTKKASKSNDVNDFIKAFSSFDEMKSNNVNKKFPSGNRGFVESLLDTLDIMPSSNIL